MQHLEKHAPGPPLSSAHPHPDPPDPVLAGRASKQNKNVMRFLHFENLDFLSPFHSAVTCIHERVSIRKRGAVAGRAVLSEGRGGRAERERGPRGRQAGPRLQGPARGAAERNKSHDSVPFVSALENYLRSVFSRSKCSLEI